MTKLVIGGSSLTIVLMLFAVVRIPALRFMVLRTMIPLTHRLSVKPLRGEAYWISGGISSTGSVIGDTGVIVIDAQMFLPTARKQIIRACQADAEAGQCGHSDP